jgi:pimeloyl-ACP methyl ester carboxylesterase
MDAIKTRDGTNISFVKRGQGAPIILVGGALQTKEDHLFSKLMPLLADEFTVLSYDRRGRGESGNGPLGSVELEIEDLQALVESFKTSVYLFGNSSGAQLALRAAALNSKISKVAVYEAPFIPDSKLGSAAEYERNLRQSVADKAPSRTLKLFFSRIGVPRFGMFIMQFMPMWKKLKPLAPTLLNDALLVSDGSVPHNFHSISAQTLVLSGASEMMQEAARKLTAAMPSAQLKILSDQKHNVDPCKLADELRLFFRM